MKLLKFKVLLEIDILYSKHLRNRQDLHLFRVVGEIWQLFSKEQSYISSRKIVLLKNP